MPLKEAIIINNLSVPGIKFNQARAFPFICAEKVIYVIIIKNLEKIKNTEMQESGEIQTGYLTWTNNLILP